MRSRRCLVGIRISHVGGRASRNRRRGRPGLGRALLDGSREDKGIEMCDQFGFTFDSFFYECDEACWPCYPAYRIRQPLASRVGEIKVSFSRS